MNQVQPPVRTEAASRVEPPFAKRIESQRVLHGIQLRDDYAWLKDDNWQRVMRDPLILKQEIRDYLEAENRYADSVLAGLRPLQNTLFEEFKGRIKEDDSTLPEPDGTWAYYQRYRIGGEHPIVCRKPSEFALDADAMASVQNDIGEQQLLDGDALAHGHAYFRLGDYEHSPDHDLLAYSVDLNGSEVFDICFTMLTNGEPLDERIEGTAGSFEWSNDARTLYYVTLDDNHRPAAVWRHRIGTAQSDDQKIYDEADAGFFVGISKTESRRFVLINAHDHVTSEVWLVDANQPDVQPRLVEAREPHLEYHVSHHDDELVILTNADEAEDFKLMRAPLSAHERANWTDWVPHRPGTLIVDMSVFSGYVVRLERIDALPKIVVLDLQNDCSHEIVFDEEAYSLGVQPGFEFSTDRLRFSYSSPTTPTQTFDYDMRSRTRVLRKQQEVPSGHDPADYLTRRLFACSHDGQMVPVTLLHRAGLKVCADTPVLLYGYGSYGHAIPASFAVTRLSLVDRDFVYAIAHIRGGMEKGYRWYSDGRLMKKRNTFADFIAAAQALIEAGYGSAGTLVCHGGSAGGMLVGAVINMRPDLFKAAIAEVPFVDVLNTMCDDTLPLTPPEWPEWGNPIESREAFEYIASYSPYDNVKTQTYPNIFVNAGLTDPRVTYWEPAKWVARLRAMKTDSNQLILKTNMDAGHGGAAGRFERLRETAEVYAFVINLFDTDTKTGTDSEP